MAKLEVYYRQLEAEVWAHIEEHGEPPKSVDFNTFFGEHAIESIALGIRTAEAREQVMHLPHHYAHKLAKAPPRSRVPTSFKGLMEMWDLWRRKKPVNERQKILSDKISKAYLKKVQSAWDKYSRAFRKGDEWTQLEVRAAIRAEAQTTYSRAKMIVQTETTFFYNQARVEVYNRSTDVTHYLFVAIRDSATTKWCNTRNGIVFTKGTKLFEKNQPPVHWNCRSELLPLSPHNPVHLRLINDMSKRAENVTLFPLPRGWNSGANKRVA